MSMRSRMNKRQAARQLRRDGPKQAYLGGTPGAQEGLRKDTKREQQEQKVRESKEYEQVTSQRVRAQEDQRKANNARDSAAKRTSEALTGLTQSVQGGKIAEGAAGARGTRDAALGKDQLTGTAENVLGQRANALAASPTIGQATEAALAANRANAQQQLGQQVGLMNRHARGLAGSMGEGGALAMQQAMASAGAGAADLAALQQTEQGKLAADLRFGAAQQQRAEDVDSANMGLQTRMGAAEQERAAQLGFAGTSADEQYNAALQQMAAEQDLAQQRAGIQQLETNRFLNSAQQANAMSAGTFDAAQQSKQQAFSNRLGTEGTIFGIENQQNQAAHEAAKNRGAAAFFGKIANVGNNMKAALDSTDMGPATKFLGSTKAY